jgi:hypothetical protein
MLAAAGYEPITTADLVARLVRGAAVCDGRSALLAAVPRFLAPRGCPVAGDLWLGAVPGRDLEAALSGAGVPRLERNIVLRRFWHFLHVGHRVQSRKWAIRMMSVPRFSANKRAPGKGGIPSLLTIGRARPALPEHERSPSDL